MKSLCAIGIFALVFTTTAQAGQKDIASQLVPSAAKQLSQFQCPDLFDLDRKGEMTMDTFGDLVHNSERLSILEREIRANAADAQLVEIPRDRADEKLLAGGLSSDQAFFILTIGHRSMEFTMQFAGNAFWCSPVKTN